MSETAPKPAYMQRIGYHTMLLGGMALLASSALVIGDISTRNDIDARLRDDLRQSLRQIIPPDRYDNDPLADALRIEGRKNEPARTVYRAIKQGRVTVVAYEVSRAGYGGDIRILMGIDRDGVISGVRVIAHSETPGLGDRIEAQKSDWIKRFTGHALGKPQRAKWAVKKDGGIFDQFSGATITPRAVVTAVREGLDWFGRNSKELLDARTVKTPAQNQ